MLTHPVLEADSTIHPMWLRLCVGCSIGFNAGLLGVLACVHWLLRPLWLQNQARLTLTLTLNPNPNLNNL